MNRLILLLLAMTLSSVAAAPLIVAHRGDSSRAPENTLAAIRLGIEARADLIEPSDPRISGGACGLQSRVSTCDIPPSIQSRMSARGDLPVRSACAERIPGSSGKAPSDPRK